MIRPHRGRAVTAVALTAVLVLAAAPARATVAHSVSGTTVTVTASGGDTVAVTCQSSQVALNGSPVAPAVACSDLTWLRLQAQGGDNDIDWSAVTAADFPALIYMEVEAAYFLTGSDTIIGTPLRDVVTGDQFDVITVGDGNDFVDGGGSVNAGEGNDVVRGAAVQANGGPGDDLIEDSYPADGGEGDDTFVFDLVKNDGTVEITLVIGPATLTVINAPATTGPSFAIENFEAWRLELPTGIDTLQTVDSRTFPGPLVLNAYGGPDNVFSGPVSDVIDAGYGPDSVNPGKGSDTVRGGPGGDTISVRDGVADLVDCGLGSDSVVADRVDVLSGCESVSLPPPGTSKIAGPTRVPKGDKATFTFSSEVAGARFECKIDSGAYKSCTSPFKVKTKNLSTGKHKLFVRAVQPAGNADTSPSSKTFKVA